MKVRDLIKQLEQNGWYIDRTRGSHRQFKHPAKPGLVTVHGHPSDDVPIGTLNNIFKQAQIGNKR
ncbi:type II toxin-antitoxin system HicA family toxin [bacterium]|nr:type II toxin-antitoxin system HicA family toxin [bacterium]